MKKTKYGYAIAIAAAAILLMVSSVNHPIIGQQIRETIADAVEGEPTWVYYNQVRANKGLTPEEAREKGSHKFDGPDEDGNDPYERCEQQVANGEYDSILEAVLAEFDRTHRPSSGEADPARLGSTLTAHEETIKTIDQSKLSDEEKQRLNLVVMPDEHHEVVGKRPNDFMNHAERGMAGYEYAQKCYEIMVENHKLATPSIEKIEDSYTSQTFQEPYSLEMGGNRPKVVVEQSVHEGGYMLVWTYPDGTREEYRVNCGFQWINTQNHGWTPLEWNPPSSDNPPSKPDEPDEPNKSKDMSEEMQSAHPGNSSVDGRNDTSKDDESDIPPENAPSKTNPDTGRGENPGRPANSGKSDKSNDEASKGTESGSKKSDETDGKVETVKTDEGDFSGTVTATDGKDRDDYGEVMDNNPPPVVPGANGNSGGSSSSSSKSSSGGSSSSSSKSSSGGSSSSSSGGGSKSSSGGSSSSSSGGGSKSSSGGSSSSSSKSSSGGSSSSSSGSGSKSSSGGSSSSSSNSSSSSSSGSDGGHNKLNVDEDFDLD